MLFRIVGAIREDSIVLHCKTLARVVYLQRRRTDDTQRRLPASGTTMPRPSLMQVPESASQDVCPKSQDTLTDIGVGILLHLRGD